jgi:3-deoxy-manno-octulosonate cytidylyltransferase (CMP-KDO synthetase)
MSQNEVAGVRTGGVLVVIPARYDSSRFPGKPLADLGGMPMVQQVWRRAIQAKRADRVVVASDDDRILKVVEAFGGEGCRTSSAHRTGTERVAEVAEKIPAALVVNLQGDLPLFLPETLDRLIDLGLASDSDALTVKSEITDPAERLCPSSVKVVTDLRGRALYFSRSPIPYPRTENIMGNFKYYKHYGIYLFRRDFLLQIAKAPEGRLEGMEQLEQLRILEQGGTIQVAEIGPDEAASFWEVNLPEDLVRAREMLL